jgi:hypothetical protein
MEESATAIDTKRLTTEARQALREAYVPEVGRRLTTVESALINSMSKLIHAVERSVQEGYVVPTFTAPTESDEQYPLDELCASIMGGTEPTGNTSQRKFVISFPDVELSVNEVWPDDDAPEDPTPTDVIEQMRGSNGVDVLGIASSWSLIESLSVRYPDEEESEVEWDGF